MRTTRTWTVSLPPNLIREALRVYIEERRWRELQRDTSARAAVLGLRDEEDVEQLVDAGRR